MGGTVFVPDAIGLDPVSTAWAFFGYAVVWSIILGTALIVLKLAHRKWHRKILRWAFVLTFTAFIAGLLFYGWAISSALLYDPSPTHGIQPVV